MGWHLSSSRRNKDNNNNNNVGGRITSPRHWPPSIRPPKPSLPPRTGPGNPREGTGSLGKPGARANFWVAAGPLASKARLVDSGLPWQPEAPGLTHAIGYLEIGGNGTERQSEINPTAQTRTRISQRKGSSPEPSAGRKKQKQSTSGFCLRAFCLAVFLFFQPPCEIFVI